jgi:hypothetical protein
MPNQWVQTSRERLAALNPAYSWQREFIPRDNIGIFGSTDFPQESYSAFTGAGTLTLNELPSEGCFAVTGESGSGKSGAIWQETIEADRRGVAIRGYDLAVWTAQGMLEQLILHDPDLTDFLRSSGPRCLFFDSFDDSYAAKAVLPQALSMALDDANWSGLRVLIGSQPGLPLDRLIGRTRSSLAGAVVHILPLTSAQIRAAADESGLDGAAFVSALDAKGVTALAVRPLPLSLMISEVQKNGVLASSQAELHARHIGVLCAATPGSSGQGTLTSQQRMVVASRMAAFSRIGNTPTISVADGPSPSARVLAMESCVGGSETSGGYSFDVAKESVEETLRTGLFFWADTESVIWSHRGYSDYLAGWWLSSHGLSSNQAVDLITSGEPRRLVPELYGLASWLAALVPGALEELLLIEPEVVLFGTALDAAHANAEATVSALLAPPVAKRMTELRPFGTAVFERLEHDALAAQLQPILDNPPDENVALMALLIARGCKVVGLDDPIVAIALDDSQPRQVRSAAIAAARDTATPNSRRKLRDDDVKGLLLQTLWPDCISVDELFGVVPDQRSGNSFTTLDMFLGRDLVRGLVAEDLPVALVWCQRVDSPHLLSVTYEDALSAIIELAGEHLELEDVRSALFELLKRRWTSPSSRPAPTTVAQGLGRNQDARRELIALALASDRPLIAMMEVIRLGLAAISPDDVEWLRDQAVASANDEVHTAVGFALRIMAERGHAVEQISALRPVNPEVDRQLAIFFDPIDPKDRPPIRTVEEPAPRALTDLSVLLSKALQTAADPTPEWLAVVQLFMEARREDRPGGSICDSDLWRLVSGADRTRVCGRAIAFLEAYTPPPRWFAASSYPYGVSYGESALLLADCNDGILAALQPATRRVWIPAVLTSIANTEADLSIVRRLCTTFYGLEPDAFLECLADVVTTEAARYGTVLVLNRLQDCWDDRITDVIMEVVSGGGLAPKPLKELLSECLVRANPQAREVAQSLLQNHGVDDAARLRAVAAARALINTPDAAWELIWPVILADEEFGRMIFIEARQDLSSMDLGLGGKLQEDALGDLYEWLVTAFPDTEDPVGDRAERGWIVGGASDMIFLRSAILEALVRRGSEAACAAIQNIADRHPDQSWWPSVLERARAVMRQTTWEGVSPQVLLALVASTERRLVDDEAGLRRAVEEALQRIQMLLVGDPPMAQFLWNTRAQRGQQTVRSPKDENTFSDFIATLLILELRDRGIVVNREVQIRRGQETDIYITAVTPTKTYGVFERVTVIIEAKGCWHPDLKTAMKDQLVDRYLKIEGSTHGLYLVGWFFCAAWANEARKRRCPESQEELVQSLLAQAEEATTGGITVRSVVLDARWPIELSDRDAVEAEEDEAENPEAAVE